MPDCLAPVAPVPRFDRTYEELKPLKIPMTATENNCFDRTYEELKLSTIGLSAAGVYVLIVPMRN